MQNLHGLSSNPNVICSVAQYKCGAYGTRQTSDGTFIHTYDSQSGLECSNCTICGTCPQTKVTTTTSHYIGYEYAYYNTSTYSNKDSYTGTVCTANTPAPCNPITWHVKIGCADGSSYSTNSTFTVCGNGCQGVYYQYDNSGCTEGQGRFDIPEWANVTCSYN